MSDIFSQLKIRNILDRDPDKFEPRPEGAWAVIFSATIVLIVLILVVNISFYAYIRADTSFKSDDSSPVTNEVKLNRKGLAEITALFETKNTQFQNLLASPPKIADPSESMGREVAPTNQSVVVTPQKKTLSKTATSSAPVSF